jgi:sugar lactone lactonase YvrE
MKTFATGHVKALVVAVVASCAAAAPSVASAKPFLDRFSTISTLATTVPASGPAQGDQNPYGVAVVKRSVGDLVRGDVLVSNFNNSQNQQGTGSSIVEVSPSGHAHVFAVVPQPTATPAVGLTTALVVLRSGFVIVGSLPAPGGMSSAAGAGALTILDANGHVVETLSGGDINGPWDMTAVDHGRHVVLFVTNVLNGTVAANGAVVDRGTVVRITLRIRDRHIPEVTSNRVIATGFGEHTDPNALVVGPTGVGFGEDGVLYVADSNGNRIAAIPHALTRMSVLGGGGNTVSSGGSLNDPLGLAIAPNGDIITVNGADGNAIETTPGGHQVETKTLVANGAGDLFGLAIAPHGDGIYFVNDIGSGPAANSLQLLH